MNQNDQTLTRAVLEVVAIADEFCKYLEDAGSQSSDQLIKALRGFVPLLYLRGSLLKATEPEYPEANERYITEEQWENMFNNLRNLFGESDEFWYIDYMEANHHDPIKASMAECLADVYQDLNDFVMLFKQNSLAARENAIFSCHMLFHERWGQRLALLLPVLHALQSERGNQTYDNLEDNLPFI